MRILSANDMDVTVVSRPLMLVDADLERAGKGAGVTVYAAVSVAILIKETTFNRRNDYEMDVRV